MRELKRFGAAFAAMLCLIFLLASCALPGLGEKTTASAVTTPAGTIPEVPIPSEPYRIENGGIPLFTDAEITTEAYEYYSPLDSLGRCGYVMACIGRELMPAPDEERESISSVKPSGWQSTRYPADIVSGGYLYNRCHLIGWQLTAENANKQNLITGTRYLNIEGMLDFEEMVADYIKETGNHVMYRVTPVYTGDNLVADGVYMEGYSVEDEGDGICFYVYCYNIQPGIVIDYRTGESRLSSEPPPATTPGETTPPPVTNEAGEVMQDYILNMSSMRFHKPSCASCDDIKAENKSEYHGTREYLIEQGYQPCGSCKP